MTNVESQENGTIGPYAKEGYDGQRVLEIVSPLPDPLVNILDQQ